MTDNLFPRRGLTNPRIYAYSDTHPQYDGLLKVGYTTRSVEERVKQQFPTVTPGPPVYRIVVNESAMREDGTVFTDKDIHRQLVEMNIPHVKGEWFRCSEADVKEAVEFVAGNKRIEHRGLATFSMRPEQADAVAVTAQYFRSSTAEEGRVPHFLWNAKMRFGKTFAAYKLAERLGWKRVLVLTFKPAVESAWKEDLLGHRDFRNWRYIGGSNPSVEEVGDSEPLVCFGSFQNYLGKNDAGGIKAKNEWVHKQEWDCVILDEYHYGAWRDRAKGLFDDDRVGEMDELISANPKYFEESVMPIKAKAYLYLSGTPFRALASGEFIEEQIYNWTYADEQRAKSEWNGPNNPYRSLPRMVLMTYQVPESISEIVRDGEFNEFDLNEFFRASGEHEQATFEHQSDVQKWLNLIRGAYLETSADELKLGTKPPFPFSDARLLSVLNHTFWFLPTVASCYAMRNLLGERQNVFFHDYETVVVAGPRAGSGVAALKPIRRAMDNPLVSKTITLSCGKLATGVTVRPWTGMFMLRNIGTPETYFQAAFRVQSPWEIDSSSDEGSNVGEILKEVCYVFDFAPNRALRQITEYCSRSDVNENNPEEWVSEFISYLPVLAYDGSVMRQLDAAGILDIVTTGTSGPLLARKWESALLVNVDDATLRRLLNDTSVMDALSKIEGFRHVNRDLDTIINKSESIRDAKRQANKKGMSDTKKRELDNDKRERDKLRRKIRDKLIKFAARIPIFMYLTDYRERCLRDVITKLEPGLFKKVTGLLPTEFEQLVSLNVFNSALMNDAIFKFKRYEDTSLSYTGINRHAGKGVGLFDTVLPAGDVIRQVDDNDDVE